MLLHRAGPQGREVLLVHPGGPFWRKRQAGAWQIPKGVIEDGEAEEAAARREAAEELGIAIDVPLARLAEIRQAGGKTVIAFAAELDIDVAAVASNTVEIEWPPRSGRRIAVPEIDEARWFAIPDAAGWILPSQAPLLDALAARLGTAPQLFT